MMCPPLLSCNERDAVDENDDVGGNTSDLDEEDAEVMRWGVCSRSVRLLEPCCWFGVATDTPNSIPATTAAVSYTHLRAHETPEHLVCRLLLEKKKITERGTAEK
eukprot:TRINITY_DN27651_c0_g1_i2.p1 TRINITY_DN27651_c0_g1~~TRINITY_DN27651_c0_g1_i2.p1  ORF type:complete len:105 (-),score=22.74 TRINITY_DN27651_c0_g1_i2:83-397(-)